MWPTSISLSSFENKGFRYFIIVIIIIHNLCKLDELSYLGLKLLMDNKTLHCKCK